MDIVKKLLDKDPTKRLGSKNDVEILSHPFFSDLDLIALNDRKIVPSFKPK